MEEPPTQIPAEDALYAAPPRESWLRLLEANVLAVEAWEHGGDQHLDVQRLVQDAAIVRHRGKIESTINNARRALELIDEWGSLAAYAWRYEPQPARRPRRITLAALTALTTSPESVAMAKDLKRRGWSFVGPTTVYAFMQSMGLVNDHLEGCRTRDAAAAARASVATIHAS